MKSLIKEKKNIDKICTSNEHNFGFHMIRNYNKLCYMPKDGYYKHCIFDMVLNNRKLRH